MPTSRDPARRARQLQNLQRGGGRPTSSEHTPAVTHGGYAQVAAERLDARVREVYGALAADAPLRAEDGSLPRFDSLAVTMLARALCRLDDVEDSIRRRGYEDADGNERPAVERAGRLSREVMDWTDRLGLSPMARAKLGLTLGQAAGTGILDLWSSGATPGEQELHGAHSGQTQAEPVDEAELPVEDDVEGDADDDQDDGHDDQAVGAGPGAHDATVEEAPGA